MNHARSMFCAFISYRIFERLVVLTFYPFSMWSLFFRFPFVCSCFADFFFFALFILDAITISTKCLDRACGVAFEFNIVTAAATEATEAIEAAIDHYSG